MKATLDTTTAQKLLTALLATTCCLFTAGLANAATQPDIHYVKVNGTTVSAGGSITLGGFSIGDTFRFKILVENNGDDSPAYYNNITACFSQFTSSSDKSRVSLYSKTSDLNYNEYFGSEVGSGDGYANWVMVESASTDVWDGSDYISAENESFSITLTPKAYGNFYIYYRAAMSNQESWTSGWTYNPSSNWYTDCLGFRAYRIRVVLPAPDTTPPHNPSSFSSNPPTNTWTTDNTVYVSWSGAYDNVGLKRYYYKWTTSSSSSVTTSDNYTNTSSGSGSKTSPSLSDSPSWYFHIRYMDTSDILATSTAHYGPFKIDRTDPGKPTQQSPSNGGSVSTLRPTLTWSAASDGSGSGVAKYHLKVFQNWGVYWDKVDKDVTGTSYTLNESEALEWGKNYGWRLYAIDNVDNDGDYTGNWYFTVQDTVKPHNPNSYTSTPPANTWSNSGTISVTWSGAYDNESGLDGYSVVWNQSPTTVPYTTNDQSGNSSSTSYADGSVWSNIYCHVRAVDKAGNWANGALHCGPFNLDREDPGKPTQQSPSNGGSVSTLRPTLTWSTASDGYGSGVKEYQLLVETDPLGVNKVDKLVNGTSYTLDASEALDGGEVYKWKVRAIDNAENPGDWSEQWFFSVTEQVVLSNFPDYGTFNVAHPCSPGGICGASGAAAILGYWDRTAYQGITYWNLVDHGGPSTPDASGDVEGLVESLVSEMSYGHEGWWLWPFLQMDQADRDGIITICNDLEYRNNLDFVGNLDDWVHTYDMLKTEIKAGRPLMYGIERILPTYVGHWLPVYGFRHTAQNRWVTAKRNTGYPDTLEYNFDEGGTYGSLDCYIRITPGGIPVDHYEDDNSSLYANVIEPEDNYNWLQTHNFDIASDQDWVQFTAEVGYEYLVQTENLGGYASTNLYIYKASDLSTPVVYDADGGEALVSFDCIDGMEDTYYILIINASAESGPDTNYDLTIEELSLTQYDLNMTIVGQGHVNLDPPNIDVYPPGDSYTYIAGTVVILTANSEPGWHFVHWEGDATGTLDTAIVTMDSQKNVTAIFEEDVVIVPDVVGMTEADAEAAIIAVGLTVGNKDYTCDDTLAAGYVNDQYPTAGSSVPLGSQVNLGVSTGPCLVDLNLTMDNLWMYQNRPSRTGCGLTACVSINDDPLGNTSYSYEWEFILPSDVSIAPTTIAGGGSGDECWTFAAPGCDQPQGLSDSGQVFKVRVTVTGDDYGNVGIAEVEFGICLLGDVNNDSVVNAADRGIINAFWRTGAAGPFTLRDCDINCDGVVNAADRGIANAIWRGALGQNSVSTSCPFR